MSGVKKLVQKDNKGKSQVSNDDLKSKGQAKKGKK
jgi:hypothetical protein